MRAGPWLAAAALAILAFATPAAAEPITKSDYTLEYFQGPVTSSSRVIGLAGAFTAIAEWCEGEYANAASPAAVEAGSAATHHVTVPPVLASTS